MCARLIACPIPKHIWCDNCLKFIYDKLRPDHDGDINLTLSCYSMKTPSPVDTAEQLPLDFAGRKWPPANEVPVNWPPQKLSAGTWFREDLAASSRYSIITGFTSLNELVKVFGSETVVQPPLTELRVMLGFEQMPKQRKKWPSRVPLADEIRDYWLREGISIADGGALLHVVKLLREPASWLQMRLLEGLHAKVYVGDTHAMLGSSNFSQSGLKTQIEANLRFAAADNNPELKARYGYLKCLADNFWEEGEPYNARAADLLEKLLRVVTWPEALARAVAELLRGDALFAAGGLLADLPPLWPHQRHGIAQALYILDKLDHVLVADPAGSGKTKLVGTLLVALERRRHARAAVQPLNAALVAPPSILKTWEKWWLELKRLGVTTISNGQLSKKPGAHDPHEIGRKLDIADIVVLDEAHQYLNAQSWRTQRLTQSSYQHLLLTTATPLNRHANDLLRLVELLDVDNLSDEALLEYERLRIKPFGKFSEADLKSLRSFIGQFLLRRTRSELQQQIKASPAEYARPAPQRGCNYPKHNSREYKTDETEADQALAEEMRLAADELAGLSNLLDLRPKRESVGPSLAERRDYIEQRLLVAPYLARFQLRHTLRSSRAALWEHLWGSEAAYKEFGLSAPTDKNLATGVIDKLRRRLDEPPTRDKHLPPAVLPAPWLHEAADWRVKCEAEIAAYERIGELLRGLSNERERGKVKLVARLVREYQMVLAFDHSVISAEWLAKLCQQDYPAVPQYVVTSKTRHQTNRKKLGRDFGLAATPQPLAAFCTDAVSEALNLQLARAVVQLDMPTVLRLAEQRTGRLDRLDSPHETIYAYWPIDTPAFSVKADEHLIKAMRQARHLIGNNLPLPDAVLAAYVDADEGAALGSSTNPHRDPAREAAEWVGFTDALQPVRDLIGVAPNGLVPPEVYEDISPTRESVKCKVSYVPATTPWAFFALSGDETYSGRWLWFEDTSDPDEAAPLPLTDVQHIAARLRSCLTDRPPETLPWKDGDATLQHYLGRLRQAEVDLLPPRARRALRVGEELTRQHLNRAQDVKDFARADLLRRVLEVGRHTRLQPGDTDAEGSPELIVDAARLAAYWLRLLMPAVRKLRREKQTYKRLISLKSLRNKPQLVPLPNEQLEALLADTSLLPTIDYRIAACIIGVPPPPPEAAPDSAPQADHRWRRR